MKSKWVTGISLAASMWLASPAFAGPGGGEVLLINVTCSNVFPFPDPTAPLQVVATLSGSGTVTGSGGPMSLNVAGLTGSCVDALGTLPSGFAGLRCVTGGVSGNDSSASVSAVCEGPRKKMIEAVAGAAVLLMNIAP